MLQAMREEWLEVLRVQKNVLLHVEGRVPTKPSSLAVTSPGNTPVDGRLCSTAISSLRTMT